MRSIRLRAFEGAIDFPGPLRPWIAAIAGSPGPGTCGDPAKVLVVDGDPKVRALCRATLEQAGFEVATAGDGKSALTAIRRERFFAVVVEMLMPGMDGVEILRHIRQHFPALAVIAMNAGGGRFDYLKVALKLGADDILSKPLDPAALAGAVQRQERLRNEARAEQRHYIRQNMALSGQLFMASHDAAMTCEVINLGAGGALVTCHQSIDQTQPVILHIGHFGCFECRVVEVTGAHIRLEFTIGPAKRARLKNMLEAHARHDALPAG